MRRIITYACLLLCVFYSCQKSSKQEEIRGPKVGFIFNITGDQSSLDVPSFNGAKLAFDQLQYSKKKILTEMKMVFRNGKTKSSVVAEGAKALSKMPEMIALIGLSDDDMAQAAGKEIEKQQTIFISSGATSPLLPELFPTYFFLVAFGDNSQAAAAAEFAYNDLQRKTCCILFDKDMDYTRLLNEYFHYSYTEYRGKILSQEEFSHNSLDIQTQLERIKKLNPQMIYLASGPEEASQLIKKIRDFGLKQPIFGGDSFDSSLLLLDTTDIYYTAHAFLDPASTNPQISDFISSYKKMFNQYPPNAFAALGYDAVNLLADALERADSYETSAILNALNDTRNFNGVTGTISYQQGNHVPIKPITIISIKQGKKVKEAELIPENVSPVIR